MKLKISAPSPRSTPKQNGYRKIENLTQAELSSIGPGWKQKRLKGAKAAGRAYERKLHKRLKRELDGVGTYYAGQWIKFVDGHGKGFAQPDGFLVAEHVVVLFECKLSQTETAFIQMRNLYVPLLEYIFDLEVMPVQVCKYLRYSAPGIVSGLNLHKMTAGSTLNWIGD